MFAKRYWAVIFVCFAFIPILSAAGAKAKSTTAVFVQKGLIGGVKIEAARLGEVLPISEFSKRAKDFECSVLAGRLKQSQITGLVKTNKVKIDKSWLGEQGYQVIVIPSKAGKTIIVTAATDVGVLYGVIGLKLRMDKLGLKSPAQWSKSYHDRPVFKYRGGKGRLRGNWQTSAAAREPMHDIFLYEDYPEIFPSEKFKKQYIERVAKTEARLRKQLAEAEKYGAKVLFFTYQPTIVKWGRENFYKAHPDARPVFDGHHKVFLCPSSESSKKFIYSKWRALFKRFPTASGVLLSMCSGDGAGPYCGCAKCKDYPMRQRVIDYVKIIRSAIQSVNPKAVVVVRSWGLPTDMATLPKDLPDDVYFFSKITCPPGNDYLWRDHFCRYLKLGVPRFVTCGTCTTNTDGAGVPFLLYTGKKQKIRAIKIVEKGCVGAWAGGVAADSRPKSPPRILSLPSRAARVECGWDPYAFDGDKFLLQWAGKRFGKAVGQHVYNALKDTKVIADAFTSIAPLRTNIFHMFVYPGCGGSGYGGATPLQRYPLAKELLAARPADVQRLKKKFEIARPIQVSRTALNELESAAKLAPKNKEIQTYLTMAKVTVCLTQMWRDYHLSLLYKCVENNSTAPAEIAKYAALARQHAEAAYKLLPQYLENYVKIYPYILKGPYYRKHPGLYNAFIVQQVTNAYHQAALRPQREKLFPVTRSHLLAKPVIPGGPSHLVDINKPNATAVKMLSRKGVNSMVLRFDGDLSTGGMLYFVYGPYADGMWYEIFNPYDLERKDRYNGAWAKLEIKLDGRKIATVSDFMTRHSRCNLLRYVKLPPTIGQSHKLEISLADGMAALLRRLYIYGPAGSKLITPSPDIKPFTEDFSKPAKWKVSAKKGASCKAAYDAKSKAMEVKIYKQPSPGVVYMPLGRSYESKFVFECDLTWKQAPKNSRGAFKLFGGADQKRWRLNPMYISRKDMLYGPTRGGHYCLYMQGEGDGVVKATAIIMDANRGLVRGKGAKLKVGRKYRLRITRSEEAAGFTITDADGVVMDTKFGLSEIQDFAVDKVGFQNIVGRAVAAPIVVQIDSVRLR